MSNWGALRPLPSNSLPFLQPLSSAAPFHASLPLSPYISSTQFPPTSSIPLPKFPIPTEIITFLHLFPPPIRYPLPHQTIQRPLPPLPIPLVMNGAFECIKSQWKTSLGIRCRVRALKPSMKGQPDKTHLITGFPLRLMDARFCLRVSLIADPRGTE